MKSTLIFFLTLCFIGLSLNFLPLTDLLPETRAVVTNFEYSGKATSQPLISTSESSFTTSAINPDIFRTKNETEWQQNVISYGFDPDQIAHQEALNMESKSVNSAVLTKQQQAASDSFSRDITLGYDPNSGEKTHMRAADVRQLISNINRQIESIKKLKNHVLKQTSADELPIQKFEQDSEKELLRLQNLKHTILSASDLIPE